MIQSITIIAFAYILDLVFGDPSWLPHPVRGIGYLAQKLEMPLRKAVRNERVAGAVFGVSIIAVVYFTSFALIHAADYFNRYLGIIVSVFFIYTSLAIKDLEVESMRVYHALKDQDIALARRNLGLIVGRDTKDLSELDIIRATVETIAENIVDGIIAPLFYLLLGGPALALAYKAVNTLDSMVGYKNDRFKDFGWLSARIDDWANFIPARVSGFILPIASWLLGMDAISSFKAALADGKKNPSPNSGIPEAAVAGALGVRLGGLNFYNSVPMIKPIIGVNKNALSLAHIKKSIKIAYISSLLSIILVISVIYILHR